MATTIKLKRSSTTGDTPLTSEMELGEIAVNTYDGKLFVRGNNGSDFVNEISSITQGGGSNADTLDNLDSSQFLRSDANDSASGDINFTGALTKDSNTVWHNGNQPFYIATNTNNVAGVWKASISEVTAYEDGQLIAFYPNKIDGSSSGTTFEINSLGAKTVTRPDYSTSSITTHYDGTNLIFLRYVSADDYFIVHADYNSTDDYRIRWSSYVTVNNSAGSGVAVHGYQLLMEGIDGKFYPVTEGGSTANTNAVSTAEMRIGGTILYYESSTDRNANTTTPWGVLYESIASGNMEYWNNRDSGWATTYRPIYLVATINSNGNFVLDNTSYTSFLTQDLPTSDDGKYYIRIGWMQDDYDDWRLEVNHPIYVYKDGMVREWGGYANNSDKLDNQTGSYYLDYTNFSNTPANATTSTAGLMSSTDKSKLDGIETGATGDQTASEILTLIKTVDGAGSGLDADTLDGATSGAFLRSNSSDTFDANQTLTFGSGSRLAGDSGSLDGFFMPQNPEGKHIRSPFFFNDIAYARLRGATVTVDVDGTAMTSTTAIDNMLNANTDFWNFSTAGATTVTITITNSPKNLFYGSYMGVTFGNTNWRAKDVTFEVFYNSQWNQIHSVTNQGEEFVIDNFSSGSTATTGFRWTFSNFNSTSMRIVSLFAYNYNSSGMEGLYVTRDGGTIYDGITVNGNIATTGTVDGRDVAADGSKLDTTYGWGDHASAGYASSLSDLSVTSTAAELNILDVSVQSPTDGQALTYSTANGLEWGSVASDSPFVENDQTITESYTVASGKNAQGVGPITINNGATITVSTGSKLVIT